MRRWFIGCMSAIIAITLVIIAAAWIIDPYFHYHKPFSVFSYRLRNERYINDGISRNFEYDALITGTSMAQNFKTSEADKLLGVKSVKEPFAGAGFRELSQNIDRALRRNANLKTVIWSVDFNSLIRDKDYDIYVGYPEYLYDDNLFNDMRYIFNKTMWYEGIMPNIAMTIKGQKSTTFDEYSAWNKELGFERIMAGYDRWEERAEMIPGLDDEAKAMVAENVRQNLVELAGKYPDTTFYFFYTPYSICWWDFMNQEGMMMMQFDAEIIATELLLDCPNVKLYNFNDKYDIINNPDNYRDKEHYGTHVNSQILEWIADGDGLVTKENYMERLREEMEHYLNYDYESIFR